LNINDKLINQLIHDQIAKTASKRSKMKRFFDYYAGEHDILGKEDAGTGKPDNRLVYNFCELIIDTNHSYLFSKPYSMDIKTSPNKSFFQKIFKKADSENLTDEFLANVKEIYHDNDEEIITSNHGKTSGIAGESVEVHWIDKNGNIKFVDTDPREWVFFKYDGVDFALRHFKSEEYVPSTSLKSYELKEYYYVELYTDEWIREYKQTDIGEFELQKELPHFYGEIPVIRLYNKDSIANIEGQSDLKNVIALNDAINKAQSSQMNTLEYHGDPYMIFKNFGLDDEGVQKIKESRVIEMHGLDMDVSFLQWDHNVEAYEKFLDRVERLIFILSFTPDIFAKEGLTSDSGISLIMKFIGADLKSQQKERVFIKGLRKRLRLLAKQLEAKTNRPYYSQGVHRLIEINFNRNMPQNTKELVEMVKNLAGTVSDETRIKLLPFVENAEEEIEKTKQESGYPIDFGEVKNEQG
jgi:SPP1 family phage portal protein